jgi:hypothetical protein
MPDAEPTPAAAGRMRRDGLLRQALAVAAAAGAGASGLQALERAAAADAPSGDVDVLNFLLSLEELQSAYYAFATSGGSLSGGLVQFARTAAAHERAHVAALRGLLGGDAKPAPSFAFGLPPDAPTFTRTAVQLEELAIAGQNGAGALLSRTSLALVVRISSTDARHAAWVRDIARINPVPSAVDPGRPPAEIARAVKATGFVQ